MPFANKVNKLHKSCQPSGRASMSSTLSYIIVTFVFSDVLPSRCLLTMSSASDLDCLSYSSSKPKWLTRSIVKASRLGAFSTMCINNSTWPVHPANPVMLRFFRWLCVFLGRLLIGSGQCGKAQIENCNILGERKKRYVNNSYNPMVANSETIQHIVVGAKLLKLCTYAVWLLNNLEDTFINIYKCQ